MPVRIQLFDRNRHPRLGLGHFENGRQASLALRFARPAGVGLPDIVVGNRIDIGQHAVDTALGAPHHVAIRVLTPMAAGPDIPAPRRRLETDVAGCTTDEATGIAQIGALEVSIGLIPHDTRGDPGHLVPRQRGLALQPIDLLKRAADLDFVEPLAAERAAPLEQEIVPPAFGNSAVHALPRRASRAGATPSRTRLAIRRRLDAKQGQRGRELG